MTDSAARLSASLRGRYRVEREIGAGGMATVYLAHDDRHDRNVAIKVLRPEFAAAIGSSRFLQEIKLTANLQHPHILPLYDSGEADGAVFYVMPYVQGESLRARITREKQLPVDEALRITRAIAGALEYAHRHGVIHRDIKPENILLSGDAFDRPNEWQPLVADFGVALAMEKLGHTRLTESGLAVGTPSYMSPEQASAERRVDARTDVYALGAILYEMLAGEPPFSGPTTQAIVSKVMTEQVPPLRSRRGSVPQHVETAVLKALAKVPADRFPSAAQFAEALGEREERPDPTSTSPVPPSGRAWKVYAPWLLAAAATIVAIVFAARSPSAANQPAIVSTNLLPPPGEEFSDRWSFGALSPDGRRFAFITRSSQARSRLWVRDLDKLEAKSIPAADGADAPFWSFDGKSIAYFQDGKLWRMDADGGTPILICDASFSSPGDWGSDDTILFAAEDGIRRVPASGGESRVVLKSRVGQSFVRPSFASGGRYAVFSEYNAEEILLGNLETGESTVLLAGARDIAFIPPDFVTYTRQGSARDPALYLQRVNLESARLIGPRVPLADQVRSAWGRMSYSVSRTGMLAFLPGADIPRTLVVNRSGIVVDSIRADGTVGAREAHDRRWLALGGDKGLWLYDGQQRSGTLLNDGVASWSPVWSPDDSLIVYSHWCGVAVASRSGAASRTLISPAARECLRTSDWSANGNEVLYWKELGVASAKTTIWSYNVTNGKSEAVLSGKANVSEGTISPDGRLLAYVSDETGGPEVYVRPFRALGAPSLISAGGGRTPRWRSDGRELYFQTPDGQIMSLMVQPGADVQGRTTKPLFRAIGWGRNSFVLRITPSYEVSSDGTRFYLTRGFTYNTAILKQNVLTLLDATHRTG